MFFITDDNTFSIDIPGFSEMHYISWAQGGLTYPREIISSVFNKNRMEIENTLFSKINAGNETVCFYPFYNITLMPYSPDAKDQVVYDHFNDALKAQKVCVKASTLVFDMRSYRFYGANNNQNNYDYVEMIRHAYVRAELFAKITEDWWILVDRGDIAYEQISNCPIIKQHLVSTPVFLKVPPEGSE